MPASPLFPRFPHPYPHPHRPSAHLPAPPTPQGAPPPKVRIPKVRTRKCARSLPGVPPPPLALARSRSLALSLSRFSSSRSCSFARCLAPSFCDSVSHCSLTCSLSRSLARSLAKSPPSPLEFWVRRPFLPVSVSSALSSAPLHPAVFFLLSPPTIIPPFPRSAHLTSLPARPAPPRPQGTTGSALRALAKSTKAFESMSVLEGACHSTPLPPSLPTATHSPARSPFHEPLLFRRPARRFPAIGPAARALPSGLPPAPGGGGGPCCRLRRDAGCGADLEARGYGERDDPAPVLSCDLESPRSGFAEAEGQPRASSPPSECPHSESSLRVLKPSPHSESSSRVLTPSLFTPSPASESSLRVLAPSPRSVSSIRVLTLSPPSESSSRAFPPPVFPRAGHSRRLCFLGVRACVRALPACACVRAHVRCWARFTAGRRGSHTKQVLRTRVAVEPPQLFL